MGLNREELECESETDTAGDRGHQLDLGLVLMFRKG